MLVMSGFYSEKCSNVYPYDYFQEYMHLLLDNWCVRNKEWSCVKNCIIWLIISEARTNSWRTALQQGEAKMIYIEFWSDDFFDQKTGNLDETQKFWPRHFNHSILNRSLYSHFWLIKIAFFPFLGISDGKLTQFRDSTIKMFVSYSALY